MLRTAELDYDLPPELVATRPAEPRDGARLLVVSRSDPSRFEDMVVRDLPELLHSQDTLVFNATRVLPARLVGVRAETGGRVEGLYLSDAEGSRPGALVWTVLLQGRHLRPGIEIALHGPGGESSGARLVLRGRAADEPAAWVVGVVGPGAGMTSGEVLERAGATPLPPYILRARKAAGLEVPETVDRGRYQTVYAKPDEAGSVAAPTAGLHFTPDLLDRLAARGIGRAEVVLHVGTGTFKPVSAEHVEEHPMHAEWCSMPPRTVAEVERVRSAGGRVIAVGTTAVRTLESYAAVVEGGGAPPASLSTRLLITPGYRWRWVDGLMTNFHLPRSTLLALVAALFPEGMERVRSIYEHAVRERYRFYSYGDAMLVLP